MLTTKNERAKDSPVPSPELEHEAGERLRTLLTEHLDNLDAPLPQELAEKVQTAYSSSPALQSLRRKVKSLGKKAYRKTRSELASEPGKLIFHGRCCPRWRC